MYRKQNKKNFTNNGDNIWHLISLLNLFFANTTNLYSNH